LKVHQQNSFFKNITRADALVNPIPVLTGRDNEQLGLVHNVFQLFSYLAHGFVVDEKFPVS
jgi:hypothetical protein